MNYSEETAAIVLKVAQSILESHEPSSKKLERLYVSMIRLHGMTLSKQLSNTIKTKVFGGPFRGMQLIEPMLTDLYGPQLFGCYEHELHSTIEDVIKRPYETILNIGCNFGYYAVGLGLRMPLAHVYAHDIDENAQKVCAELAAANGLENRVTISGLFRGEDFAQFENAKPFLMIDIEGAEADLLDPIKYPALSSYDIVVEMHECLVPGIARELMKRFEPTHQVSMIMNGEALAPLEELIGRDVYIQPFDKFCLAWERRGGATPWGIFTRRTG